MERSTPDVLILDRLNWQSTGSYSCIIETTAPEHSYISKEAKLIVDSDMKKFETGAAINIINKHKLAIIYIIVGIYLFIGK